ncbi:MAG TPA: tetratricopeptide repeat protein [Oscillatoriaceae cyanobacterium]
MPAPFSQLSLCMIVRDEAQKLARCLESARNWVGEIVVVDTGSTDDTAKIAASFGAEVHHFDWCDDFSAARNTALEAASGEWALVLDADEELVVTDPEEFGRALTQSEIDGFSFRVHNLLDSGEISYGVVFRLFRRDVPRMRYEGRLHEQIAAVREHRVKTATLAGCHIRHDGYTAEAFVTRDKHARNLKLARAQAEANPHDPFAWYALGLSVPASEPGGRVAPLERCLEVLDDLGEDVRGEAYVASAYHLLVESHVQLGQTESARAVADRGLALFPDAADLRYHRGHLRLAAGDHDGAREDFAHCLTPSAAAFALVSHPGHIGYAARTGLALARLNAGQYEEGEALLRQAIAEAPPSYLPPRRTLGSLLLQRGAWSEALGHLQAALDAGEDAELRFQVGWCLAKLERYEEAEAILSPLEKPEARHLLGRVLLEAGQGERALACLQDCALPAATLARGWAYYLTGQAHKAAECWEEWLRAGAADWGTKDTLAMFLFLLQGGRKPSGQPERPAEPLRDMDLWFRLLLRYQRFKDVERAVQRGPELGDRLWRPLRRKWAVTLLKEGFYDVGLMLTLQCREAEPEEADVYYWLGYCALHQQNPDDARMFWETCLELAPSHPLARQGLSLLRQDSPLP